MRARARILVIPMCVFNIMTPGEPIKMHIEHTDTRTRARIVARTVPLHIQIRICQWLFIIPEIMNTTTTDTAPAPAAPWGARVRLLCRSAITLCM